MMSNTDVVMYVKNKKTDGETEPLKLEDHTDKPFTPLANKIIKQLDDQVMIELEAKLPPKMLKDLRASALGYARPSDICRKRKRQIAKAKWMMVQHDHTCYEWSQWWPKSAKKPKRWKRGK